MTFRVRARFSTLPSLLMLTALIDPAAAFETAWPETAERIVASGQADAALEIATGVFADGRVPTRQVHGALREEVWQIPGPEGAPSALAASVRADLQRQGYMIEFACEDQRCGGFDFRFALPIATGPEMHVDLGDFYYLAATRAGADGPETLAVTVSHGGRMGYAHVLQVVPTATSEVAPVTASTRTVATAPYQAPLIEPGDTLIEKLRALGSSPLDDLTFETGASALADQPYNSLAALAEFLAEDETRRVVLVGHTDAEGSLAANIRLSEARANAVRNRLLRSYGIRASQVAAQGIGYLAPRAVNTSAEGRHANRRVEVVLISD